MPGDPAVDSFEGSHLVFVAAGNDPFDVITNAVKYVYQAVESSFGIIYMFVLKWNRLQSSSTH